MSRPIASASVTEPPGEFSTTVLMYSLCRSASAAKLCETPGVMVPLAINRPPPTSSNVIGFAKESVHSYQALARLSEFAELGHPIVVGPSRKSFLKVAIGERDPAARDWATAAAVTASIMFGAHIVRVHNVAAMADVVRVADHLLHASSPASPSGR